MDVIIALVFISLTLVAAGLVFFFTRLFDGDFEHGDRLSLLPLEDDDGVKDIESGLNDDNLIHIKSNGDDIGQECVVDSDHKSDKESRAKEEGAPHGSNQHTDEDGRL